MTADIIQAVCGIVIVIGGLWSWYIKTAIVNPLVTSIKALNDNLKDLKEIQNKQENTIAEIRRMLYGVVKDAGVNERDNKSLHKRVDSLETRLNEVEKQAYGKN